MHHVRVALERHEFVDLDASAGADAAEVVALEIEEHDVLGPLLRVGEKFLLESSVPVCREAARPGAGDRSCFGQPAVERDEALRRRRDDLGEGRAQVAGERGGVDLAQPAEEIDAAAGPLRVEAAGEVGLVDVAGGDVLLGPPDDFLEVFALHHRLCCSRSGRL